MAATLPPSPQPFYFSPRVRPDAVFPDPPGSPRQGWGGHRARAPAPGRDRGAFAAGAEEGGSALTFYPTGPGWALLLFLSLLLLLL